MVFRLKNILKRLYKKTTDLNEKNITSLLELNNNASYLDLGCDDGHKTLQFNNKIETKNIYGIEIISGRARLAQKEGIKVFVCDLAKEWPIKNNSMDVITANQVIEHVPNIDHFVSELKRVLKKGGYAVISTENGSSWHNIFASIMGWQIFSLTNVSEKQSGIGNPLALHQGEKFVTGSWTHKTIFNYQGLIDLFILYRFKVIEIRGSGYHPFLPIFGEYDVRHSHYLSLKIMRI